MKKDRIWLEPEEGYHHRWEMGTIARDIRSGQMVRVIELVLESIGECDPECGCYRCYSPSNYYSYRVQLLDGTDLRDGHFRAPEDLEKVSPLVLLAECAGDESEIAAAESQ